MQAKISIIVPTYNGEKKIPTLIAALRKQSFTDFELIVVIDGSTDQTQEKVETTSTPFPKTIIVQPNQGRAAAKNIGARHARTDVLIFYDDDMEPQPDSVLKHFSFHQKQIGLLSGNCFEYESPDQTDIRNYKASLTKKWTRKFPDILCDLNKHNLFFTAANCSMRKILFNQLGGFDGRLTDAEDYDLAWRALENGEKVFFDKTNGAIHHEQITCTSYILRLRQYQQAQAKLRALHPERKKANYQSTSFFKRMAYQLFAFSFWPRLIDTQNFLLLMPKVIRYKIYNTIIQSLAIEFPDVRMS